VAQREFFLKKTPVESKLTNNQSQHVIDQALMYRYSMMRTRTYRHPSEIVLAATLERQTGWYITERPLGHDYCCGTDGLAKLPPSCYHSLSLLLPKTTLYHQSSLRNNLRQTEWCTGTWEEMEGLPLYTP